MEQHISVGVDGKVVAVWSELQQNKKLCNFKTLCNSLTCVCVCCGVFTVKRGVSLLMSSSETSMAITPRMSWLWYFLASAFCKDKTLRLHPQGERKPNREKPGQSQFHFEPACAPP